MHETRRKTLQNSRMRGSSVCVWGGFVGGRPVSAFRFAGALRKELCRIRSGSARTDCGVNDFFIGRKVSSCTSALRTVRFRSTFVRHFGAFAEPFEQIEICTLQG